MRKILGALRRADDRFGLIEDGDTIAIGVSGGKDSMLLLKALTLYKFLSKKEYSLLAVCVDLGIAGYDTGVMAAYAEEHGVPSHVVTTDIAEVVFDIRKEKNPCSLCSKMRKGALYERAVTLGCNKAAFAHHAGDAAETFIMSMMYEARLNTLSPKAYMSRSDITLIRPLILAAEEDVVAAVRRNAIPIVKNPCPADGTTVREQAKAVLKYLDGVHDGSARNIFAAISNTAAYKLWDGFDGE